MKKTTIIIADDHQIFLDGLRSILAGMQDMQVVAEANNGVDLIKMTEVHRPDIILTDLRMPGMDGVAAVRYLKKNFPEIPVLVLSMFEEEEEIVEILKSGAKGYIPKKAGVNELLKAIRLVAANRRYYSPGIQKTISGWLKNPEETNPENELTRREWEVLDLIAVGKTSQQIAGFLNISKLTVDTHRKNIRKKLDIKSNTGLVKFALENQN
ncbi:MAG: DNA-binding response regulator [Balneolaceae bacterium]|nr:MAG: DNA-binding response regulator [Balneolaceae bacterium]